MKLNLTIVGKSMQEIKNAMEVFMEDFKNNRLDSNCIWPLNDGKGTEIDYDFTDGMDVFNKSLEGEQNVYPYQVEQWWEELRKEAIPRFKEKVTMNYRVISFELNDGNQILGEYDTLLEAKQGQIEFYYLMTSIEELVDGKWMTWTPLIKSK